LSESAQLVITGGTVYTPAGSREVDVHVAGGRVMALAPRRQAPPGARVLDARGLLVLPGALDVHVHSRDPGFPEKEDWSSLTAAAAAGGVTTVLDMPNTVPAVDSAEVLEAKVAIAEAKAGVDFGLWGLVRAGSTESMLEGLAAGGAVGFKAYLGYAFRLSKRQVLYTPDALDPDLEPPPDYGTLARLLPAVARLGLPLAVHAEDPSVLAAFRSPISGYADLLASRPAVAEAVAIAAAGVLAQRTGAHLHVVHLSSSLGLRAAKDAVRAGARLSLETAPQYLWLTEADFERVGTAMKMLPPVRTAPDRAALREALAEGAVQMVATDHAPHTDAEKALPLEEAPAGSPGVQTLYLSCLELARQLGDLSQAVRWCAEQPALFMNLYPRKGAIQEGADADLVVLDPGGTTRIRAADMRSRQRNSALEGLEAHFAIKEVLLRGEPPGAGRGRFVRPAAR